jgi:hydroxymethylglutaryl-CoA reductase
MKSGFPKSGSFLSAEDIALIQRGLALEQAEHMLENVVSVAGLPFAVIPNFPVNGRSIPLPLVTPIPAELAGYRLAADLVRGQGGFTAGSSAPLMIGQIQVLDVPDHKQARKRVLAATDELLDWLNTRNPSTISRHARAVGIEIRKIRNWGLATDEDDASTSNLQSPAMLVVHLLYDCGDAMGANLVNTACEALAPRVELLTGGRVNLLILSNLTDRRRAWARCVAVGHRRSVLQRIAAASRLAEVDLYAASTLNQWVMNGVDAVVMATGNDWRAVEAGAHAYAAREGRYRSLVRWELNAQGELVGELDLPLAVGIVGGATRVLPAAQLALRLIQPKTAGELAEVIACAGLAQNLAAIYTVLDEGE